MLENRLLSDGSVYSAKALFADIRPKEADYRHTYFMSLCLTTDSKRVFYALVAYNICNCVRVTDKRKLVQC